jgi:hypothetical protein
MTDMYWTSQIQYNTVVYLTSNFRPKGESTANIRYERMSMFSFQLANVCVCVYIACLSVFGVSAADGLCIYNTSISPVGIYCIIFQHVN